MIEGLTAFEGPTSRMNEGHLPLPPEFDKERFSGKWVAEGPQIGKAMQSEIIPSARVRAAGWQVWKFPDGKQKDKPCQRALGKGTYILMYRPKPLQQAVNKLHGNASRQRLSDEILGDSVSANEGRDPGILSHQRLEEMGIRENIEAPSLPLHRVDLEQQTTLNTTT